MNSIDNLQSSQFDISRLFEQAIQYHQAGQLEQAKVKYQEILDMNPRHSDSSHLLGLVEYQNGNYAQAISYIQQAVLVDPEQSVFLNNLGNILKETGQLDQSLQAYRKALEINPQYVEVYNNLGNVLKEMDQVDESIHAYQQALEINPRYVEVYNNLGNVLKEMDRLDESIHAYQQALEINPRYASAYLNLGNTLDAKGELDQAVHAYQQALRINPQYAEVHKNLSLSYLKQGNFKQGWKEYQWRWKCAKFVAENMKEFPQPMWDGSSLDGKSILIWPEQGMGDCIMFASLLGKLQEYAQKIFVETEYRLLPLLERSFPTIHFHTAHIPPDPQLFSTAIDFQSPIASLPQWFLTSEEDFPKCFAYLSANDDITQKCRHKYQKLAEGKALVGISWKSINKSVGKQKSIPLEYLQPLLFSGECFFINLQYEYDDLAYELDQFANNTGISIYCDTKINPLESFDDFAAQVAALDLVITISNTTAHVAGALGKPVWTLLHCEADWRWLTNRSDTPWYPSMTLFRQSHQGDWGYVVQQVHSALDGYKSAD